MNPVSPTRSLALALCLALAGTGAMAQSKDATKTISGKSANGKPLTFKELEACLKEQDALNARAEDIKGKRAKLGDERKAIEAEGQALKDGGPEVQALGEKVKAFKARQQAFSDKAADWKKRQDEFNEANRSGSAADRQRRDLQAELEELKKTEASLNEDVKSLNAEQEKTGGAFKARADAHAQAVDDWNVRSKQLTEVAQAHEDDRAAWANRCANRPYNEAFEKMIRSGK